MKYNYIWNVRIQGMSKVIVRCVANGHEFVYTSNDTSNNITYPNIKCSNCGHSGTVFVKVLEE